jgi:Domain of unknown function (DUF4258)
VSKTLDIVRSHVEAQKVHISEHGQEELLNDGISLLAVVAGVRCAIVVEDYPDYVKDPCVLCFQRDDMDEPIHVLWGLAASGRDMATLITAYRPDPARWTEDWMTRRKR